jgi:hypothetical protein
MKKCHAVMFSSLPMASLSTLFALQRHRDRADRRDWLLQRIAELRKATPIVYLSQLWPVEHGVILVTVQSDLACLVS